MEIEQIEGWTPRLSSTILHILPFPIGNSTTTSLPVAGSFIDVGVSSFTWSKWIELKCKECLTIGQSKDVDEAKRAATREINSRPTARILFFAFVGTNHPLFPALWLLISRFEIEEREREKATCIIFFSPTSRVFFVGLFLLIWTNWLDVVFFRDVVRLVD